MKVARFLGGAVVGNGTPPAKPLSFGTAWVVPVILCAILVALILLAAQIYRSVDRDMTAVVLARRASVVNLAAATLSEKFARLFDLGLSLITRSGFRQLVADGQWASAMQMLHAVPQNFPDIDHVFLASAGGQVMADTPKLAGVEGQAFSTSAWYKGISRDWRPHVSPVYTRTAEPRIDVFAVALPITKPDGAVAGILVLQVRLGGDFFAWTKNVDGDPDGMVYLVDQLGQVAFHSKPMTPAEASAFSASLVVQQLRNGTEGVLIATDPAGTKKSIFAYTPLESSGWGVVTEQPAHASIGLVARDRQLRRLLLAYGLLMFFSAAMMVLVYRVVVQRRQALEVRRRNAERVRRVAERSTELEAANRDLASFSYSVSHDLRGPLRSMDGFSLVLLEDYGDKLDEEGKDALQRIRAASQRMGNLIDDILRLSQVTRAELNLTQVDLSALAREIADTLDREQPDRALAWTIEAGLSIRADLALMRIAMQNLLQNAWKFTGKTDQAAIRVGALQRDAKTVYFVADNGAGFDMGHADKLFGAFQRLHHADEFAGTGIGLAIVQRIVRRHDGEIWAEAKEIEGATFFFRFKEFSHGRDEQDHPAG
jgi:signal transduction histidine kinase